jgi:NAD+ synthase
MDLCLYGKDHGIPAASMVTATGMNEELVERVYQMIESKRKVAKYLHAHSLIPD